MKIADRPGEQFPDFLIVGAAKSGTTSLFYYLAQHPDIYLPKAFKEPGYLCFAGRKLPTTNPAAPLPDMWRAVVDDLDAYAELFAAAREGQLIGEATPEYLYLHQETIATIKQLYGERASKMKFIAILRDPVQRIWSHYWMFRRDGYEVLPFEEAVSPDTISERLARGWHPSYDYRGLGLYADQVSAWQDAFGRDSLTVILLDDLQRRAAEVTVDLLRHLGLRSDIALDTSTSYNVSGRLRFDWLHEVLFRRQSMLKDIFRNVVPDDFLQAVKQRVVAWNSEKVKMPADLETFFREYYRDDIARLQARLDRDLGPWLRPAPPERAAS